jgi:hypothetical protein
MPSIRPISLDIRTLAQAARLKSPEVAQALDRIQNAVNVLDTRLMSVVSSEPNSGSARLDLSRAATQSLRDSAFDRYSSDRIQIQDADIVSLTAGKITAGTIDAGLINVTNISADNITSGTLNASLVTVTNMTASSITSGTIDATSISVVNLDASNIASGTLTISDGEEVQLDGAYVTATGAAATLHKQCGYIRTATLGLAAGSTYTLTLTNNTINTTTLVFANTFLGSSPSGLPQVVGCVPSPGSALITIKNIHATDSIAGTVTIQFLVVNYV